MDEQVFVAVDIGASSGRVMAGKVGSEAVRLELVHRFANGPLMRDGALRWDVRGIYAEVLAGLKKAASTYPGIVSIGIDTWAVDYGLLDADGELLHDPFSYRDGRTDSAVIAGVHQRISPAELYAITGLQFLPFNTIYQFAAERDDVWDKAATALMFPDLLAYWLTGVRQSEATNASTTGLFDAGSRNWSKIIPARLGLPASVLAPINPAGTVLGGLRPEVLRATGLSSSVVVTTVGSHDTASAVVAVPATTEHYAYVSSGTWSLVGVELDTPILTDASRLANFTNEGGVDDRIRYLRNTGGLWLLQESIREWQQAGIEVDLDHLLADLTQIPTDGPRVDPNAEEFLAPGSMAHRLAAAVERSGGRLDWSDPLAVTRCILGSLAAGYAATARDAAELSGRQLEVIHVVGGGSQNALLCQATADACGLPVIAGPVEATAIGNILVQARAHRAVSGSVEELRSLVAAGHDLRRYEPQARASA